MLIDCDTCSVRGSGCQDCVVSLMLGPPQEILDFDDDEQAALGVLANSGLVPPLRLRPGAADGWSDAGDDGGGTRVRPVVVPLRRPGPNPAVRSASA